MLTLFIRGGSIILYNALVFFPYQKSKQNQNKPWTKIFTYLVVASYHYNWRPRSSEWQLQFFFFCFFSASFLKFYYFFFIKRVFNITSCYLHIRKIQKIPLIINISGQGPPFIRHTPRQYTSYPPNKYWIPNITSLLDFTFTWLTYKAKTTKL